MVDLTTVPLTALSLRTKQAICNLLNPIKYIPCDNGLPRDWRGLAHLSDLEGEIMPMLSSHPDPTMFILQAIEKKEDKNRIANLQNMLSTIDRWDVIDDTQELMEEDARKYLERLHNSQITADAVEDCVDAKVLTVDDLYRVRQGLENQRYDAFVLYANEDMDFVNEMIDKLEKDIKLCIKDRDLIGGITFEHEAVMTLISERCNRLIVILSPDFIKSSANKFFLNYAQAISIDKRQRKIIPCLYKRCVLPPQLSYMFILDYSRVALYDFWGRLRDSIRVPNALQNGDIKARTLKDNDETARIESKMQDCLTLPDSDILRRKRCNSVQDIQNSDCVVQPKLTKSTENVSDSNLEKQKRNGLLKWTKRKLKLKEDPKKQNDECITETISIDNLPSLNNLDTLSDTVDEINVAPKKYKEKKSKKRKTLKQIFLRS